MHAGTQNMYYYIKLHAPPTRIVHKLDSKKWLFRRHSAEEKNIYWNQPNILIRINVHARRLLLFVCIIGVSRTTLFSSQINRRRPYAVNSVKIVMILSWRARSDFCVFCQNTLWLLQNRANRTREGHQRAWTITIWYVINASWSLEIEKL